MNLSEINSYITFRTGQDTTSFASADRLISINSWLQKVWTMIMASEDDMQVDDPSQTDYPTASTPLVAGQRDYPLSVALALLKVRRVDITYDGTTYYRATTWDDKMTLAGLGNDANIDGNFAKTAPYVDFIGMSAFIYPLASASDVANGAKLRIEFDREPIEYVVGDLTGTKIPPFDKGFHKMLAIGAVYDWAVAKKIPDLKADAWAELQDLEARLKQSYGRRDESIDYVMTSRPNNMK